MEWYSENGMIGYIGLFSMAYATIDVVGAYEIHSMLLVGYNTGTIAVI